MDGKQIDDRNTLRVVAEAADPDLALPADGGSMEGRDAGENVETTSATSVPLPPEELERLTNDIVAALKTVYDPEIPADIYELGLIYKVEIDDDRNVVIDMTLTAPGCPVAGEMPMWVENAVNAVPGVASTKVNLVFDPPWDQSRMSDEAKLAIGMF
jgi:FeS assembly SUF system protein